MEYFEHGDLRNYLREPLPEHEAQGITAQLILGLACMHSNGFVHGDLEPKVRFYGYVSGAMTYLRTLPDVNMLHLEYIRGVKAPKLVGQDWQLWHQQTGARINHLGIHILLSCA